MRPDRIRHGPAGGQAERSKLCQKTRQWPVSYLIVEFPGSKMTGEGFPILVDLVNSGVIRVLDLRFMTKARTEQYEPSN